MTLHDSTIYIGAPVGEDDGEGAGDEGDHPQPRLRVASPQQAEQGGEQQEAEQDVNVPVVGFKMSRYGELSAKSVFCYIAKTVNQNRFTE